MITKKKRDAKFIIYQSLYIFVIALLGLKGVTITDIPDKQDPNSTIVNKDTLHRLEAKSMKLDSILANMLIVQKPQNNEINVSFDTLISTIINREDLKELERKANAKAKVIVIGDKTEEKTTEDTKSNDDPSTTKIKGQEDKRKK